MSSNISAAGARADLRPPPRGNLQQAILASPNYQELVTSRRSLAWTLSIAILAVYLCFIFLVAFDKPLLATKVSGTTSLGIVLGLVVIVIAFLLTAIYVVRANGRFDELTNRLRSEVGQ